MSEEKKKSYDKGYRAAEVKERKRLDLYNKGYNDCEKQFKEKIQNAQMRIKKVTKNEEPHRGDHNHLNEEIDKIFLEEIGEKLT